MPHQYKYVVLGGGNAAGYAAREFVKRGISKGDLAIITDENSVAYERPALSKAYLFPKDPARLPGFHTTVGGGGDKQLPAWYEDQGIEYLIGTKVLKADVAGKKLTTDKAGDISFDKLLIATGCKPVTLADFKTPGADLGGVYYLRNVQDADKLVAGIQDAKASGNKAVVVGGGYIGLEVAAGLSLNGLDVTMVFPETHIMTRLFTPEIASFYEGYYQNKGVKLVREQLVASLEGKDGKVTTAVLKNGDKLQADLVVVGVGARPNVSLFEGQLKMEAGGIAVDGSMRSSAPDVYAAGDVAAFPLVMYGGKIQRQEHVANARQSAAHAVNAIFGSSEQYDYLPFFYSREFSLSWVFYGVNEGDPVLFGEPSSGKFGCYWVKDGQVVGGFLESGTPEQNDALKRLARERPAAPATDDLKSSGISFATSRL